MLSRDCGSTMKDRSDDPSHHERTLLPRSYILLQSVLSAPLNKTFPSLVVSGCNVVVVVPVNVEYQQAVGVGMPWDTHSGEEVPVYARGPLSHLFHGVHENNYVYHVMAYASCVGDNKQHCTNPVSPPCTMSTAAATSSAAVFFSSCLYTVLSIL